MKKQYSSSQKNYQYRLLIFGLLLIGFAVYELPTIFTFKSDLREIKGTVRDADIYVTTVSDRRGRKSQKSELIFYLNERQQKFYLSENIGNSYQNKRFQKILSEIKQSDTLSVWLKKDEIHQYEPLVFQINNKYTTLLEFETVRTGKSPLIAMFFLMGMCSIIWFLWLRYPEVLNKLWN